MSLLPPGRRILIARHGETVFNATGRMQGDRILHTPLTGRGFAQAEAMGRGLAAVLGERPDLALWASPTGRALQTLAAITEQLGLDWHQARTDPRLVEIDVGSWAGRTYAEVEAERGGPIVDPATQIFACAPDGERYPAIADRVGSWLADQAGAGPDLLVVMHGISSRVLRGLLLGLPPIEAVGTPVAPPLPQGSVVSIRDGQEEVVVRGTGAGHA